MPPTEKSEAVIGAQDRMMTCFRNGNRTLAHWWASVARDERQHDFRKAQRPQPEVPASQWWR
jgi:hypothetical protein